MKLIEWAVWQYFAIMETSALAAPYVLPLVAFVGVIVAATWVSRADF